MRIFLLYAFVAGSQAFVSQNATKCDAKSECWPTDWRALSAALPTGTVVLPADKMWSSVIKLKNKRLSGEIVPGAVVACSSSGDVVAAMRFAVRHHLLLSVKSSGHCYSGNCMVSDSLHLDLTNMTALHVDTTTMTLRAEPGTNFAGIYKACDAHGVLSVGGMCPTVGPVGFTLGGGHGPLIRKYGLGVDQLVSVDLVTGAGEQVTANASSHSDLFWALQGGGGGSFGIVVAMTLRVHPAPIQMTSLSCAWPLTHNSARVGEPILAKWMEIMPGLPNEWTFYTMGMKRPLGPKVSKWNELTMNGLLVVEGLYNGPYDQTMLESVQDLVDLGRGEQLKCEFTNHTSFKAWHDQSWFASEGPIKFRTYMASSFAQPHFDLTAHAKLVTDTVTALPWDGINMMFGVQLGGKVSEPVGGVARTSVSADFRSAVMMQENDSDWNFERADKNQIDWARRVGDAVASLDGFAGSYLNEPDPSKGKGLFEILFWGQQTFAALQKVKRKWDPAGMLNCYQCVHA